MWASMFPRTSFALRVDLSMRFAAVTVCATILLTSPAPAATETVLHSFGVSEGDGYLPGSGLTDVGGTLYGTTVLGGLDTVDCNGSDFGCGIVFSITPGGK